MRAPNFNLPRLSSVQSRVSPMLLVCLVLLVYFVYSPLTRTRAQQAPPVTAAAVDRSCGASGTPFTRTTMYFGLAKPFGTISENQWQKFLRDKVTPRFPDGLTVWEANGQWRGATGRISRERAKVLLLVHSESPEVRAAIMAIIADYKRAFQQESVLWETAPVCAAF
jgi:hypothetical protein